MIFIVLTAGKLEIMGLGVKVIPGTSRLPSGMNQRFTGDESLSGQQIQGGGFEDPQALPGCPVRHHAWW